MRKLLLTIALGLAFISPAPAKVQSNTLQVQLVMTVPEQITAQITELSDDTIAVKTVSNTSGNSLLFTAWSSDGPVSVATNGIENSPASVMTALQHERYDVISIERRDKTRPTTLNIEYVAL